ncbi:MAG: cobaltochelatase subunit CobN [Thermodesulfovibrionales bacterium]|nr:cobaltochelatase subunit CobN [Thermodesulfovibrionales bacterium]
MKVLTIMWSSYLPLLKEAADTLNIELIAYSNKQISSYPEIIRKVKSDMNTADLIILYRTNDLFWEEVEQDLKGLKERIPVVIVGSDPSYRALSSVNPEIVVTVYKYVLFNGRDNLINMLKYLLHSLFDSSVTFTQPEEIPWQGIFHPSMSKVYYATEEYLEEYQQSLSFKPSVFIGILYSRSSWVTGNLEIEKALISSLEKRNVGVIPVYFYSLKDANLGNLSGVEAIERFLMKEESPIVDGIVKLTMFFLGNSKGDIKASDVPSGVHLMKNINVPLFCPVSSYYKNKEQWLEDPQGLSAQVAWSISLPEFEGVIEPVIIGATRGITRPEEESYEAIGDRVDKLAERIIRWINLRKRPNSEKKVAFILHNNPCASVEATVGAGAHLDTIESVADILKRMKKEGYQVNPPENGKVLIGEIMDKKAISEFRWSTVEEIVDKGGALAFIEKEKYMQWFNELPENTQKRMSEAWGYPPGEEKGGIPAAMVHNNKIVLTGVNYGNAVVCVQPKRGCAGARCDGQVCKILHDPDVPPPHQYVATYKWLSREFGVDAIVHVGTHGNLEFLPGKSTGLSSGCFPDIGIDTMPHLYIYNADNPPEGTTAKRRSNAVLIDHMQTVMVKGELYGDLEQSERLLDEYERYKDTEPAKAHTISHMIMEKVKGLNLLGGSEELTHDNFRDKVREIHDRLSLLKDTYIPKGMHIFGRIPEGEKLADFIYAIVRYENTPDSFRGIISQIIRRELGIVGDELSEKVEEIAKSACKAYVMNGVHLDKNIGDLFTIQPDELQIIKDVEKKIHGVMQGVLASDETASLLNGFNGGYIEPGPSGLITRGRSDILPTGRNFYSLDPQRIPTPAAWEIGKSLAQKTIEKYLEEEGRYPENIAFYWQCTDIMWADGEGMAQMMYLMGARPQWQNNGRLKGFEIISLEELDRPRIDITVRVSGITRDNFSSTIDVLDEAVQAVANLDEPLDQNFIRKHTIEKLDGKSASDKEELRKATYRIFASMPGTYQAGTQLAIYASAWKTENDLSDVFLYWNGYAYGKGTFGEPAHQSLKESLKTVEVTFNKTVTDEYDLTGCCCYFGTHGGMINAAKVISGKDIQNYYGDTREQDKVSVRTLTEEIRRIARAKILNPKWIQGMKEHGYKGAGEISKRIGRLYGWQATAKAVDDSVFDDIARTFMMNEENRKFFEKNNPWALEEIARRLIEAVERGLWNPSPDVREALKQIYVEIEGWIEEKMGDVQADFQGGAIDIVTADEVENWGKKLREIEKRLNTKVEINR